MAEKKRRTRSPGFSKSVCFCFSVFPRLVLVCCDVCSLVNMSALQQYGGADLVVSPTFFKAGYHSWPLFAMVWVSSIFLAFLCGILFWHLWGPRFHQMREVLSGISWTLKSGIRGALVSTWRMLMWGALNLVEAKLAYETEPVLNPHMVEIDRMPPPPTEDGEGLHGMERTERMDATPTRHQRGWTPDACGSTLGVVKPKWQQNKGSSPKKQERYNGPRTRQCPQQNGGGIKTRKTRLKGPTTLSEASVMARNRSWRATARKVLKDKFFSLLTSAAKASKRRTILEVADACSEDGLIFPLSVDLLVDIAATINHTEMKAGDQYLYEVKLMHIEKGFQWTDQLERHLQMCRRALTRDRGPEDRAIEFKPENLTTKMLEQVENSRKTPKSVALSYAWSTLWMLRAIEASSLEVGHVALDHGKKSVRLYIPKSKVDQKGLGVSRCLACCCCGPCDLLCPWSLAVTILSKLRDLSSKAPLFPSFEDKRLSQYCLVKSWSIRLEGSITGHSARRSGAMRYARLGWHIQDIAFLGRWKSSAVFRYIEQALQDVPANLRAPPTAPSNQCTSKGTQEVCEKVVTVREVLDAKVTEKVNDAAAKIQQMESRVSSLEESKEQEMLMLEKSKKPLWAISNSRSGKLMHLVRQASWSLPLQDWSTGCGWKFARRHVKVELTRFPSFNLGNAASARRWNNCATKSAVGWSLHS